MIIYRELSSIEDDLGFDTKTLYALSNNISAHYRTVYLEKKNGGTRILSIPDEALKKVQSAIAERLLPIEPTSKYATAYKAGSGIIKNAIFHTNKNLVIKLDICNFFDNIKYSLVKEKAFPAIRYSENIRILLTMLCYYKDALPQGAPTSPTISNIIMYDFDNTVGTFCNSNGISYTRYCDDMTFSGNISNTNDLISFVRNELLKIGFILNYKKTKVISQANQQTVTGIVVNKKPNISNEYKRNIRKEVYFINKFGIESHLNTIANNTPPLQYLESLLGKINFVLQICPNDKDFKNYKKTIYTTKSNLISSRN